MMQLATISDGQPWCCSVYYVIDENLNLYWASWPTRRHSQEIKRNNKVAAAIPVEFTNGEKVIGIQVEGTAEEVSASPAIRKITEDYAGKFGRSAEWVDNFTAGKTKHKLYKLTPVSFILFDDEHFPDDPRQEIKL